MGVFHHIYSLQVCCCVSGPTDRLSSCHLGILPVQVCSEPHTAALSTDSCFTATGATMGVFHHIYSLQVCCCVRVSTDRLSSCHPGCLSMQVVFVSLLSRQIRSHRSTCHPVSTLVGKYLECKTVVTTNCQSSDGTTGTVSTFD